VPGAANKKSYNGCSVYACNRKPEAAYGRSANKFYIGGMCNHCGCLSEEHKWVTN
jgi:hypothetical protein